MSEKFGVYWKTGSEDREWRIEDRRIEDRLKKLENKINNSW